MRTSEGGRSIHPDFLDIDPEGCCLNSGCATFLGTYDGTARVLAKKFDPSNEKVRDFVLIAVEPSILRRSIRVVGVSSGS